VGEADYTKRGEGKAEIRDRLRTIFGGKKRGGECEIEEVERSKRDGGRRS